MTTKTPARDKRDRLVNAAAELFWTKGYAATSLADMIEELAAIDRRKTDGSERLTALLALLARGNELRARFGCPIAGAIRDFSPADPNAAKAAASTFTVLETWLSERLVATGREAGAARRLAEDVVAAWQGAIVVAHGDRNKNRLKGALRRIAERIGCAAP